MIIIAPCTKETKAALDRLVATGRYGDLSATLSAAILTLAQLDEAVRDGAVVLGQPGEMQGLLSPMVGAAGTKDGKLEEPQTATPRPKGASRNTPRAQPPPPTVPNIYSRSSLSEVPAQLAGLPSDLWTLESDIPIGRWVFGQFNKLLPAKANVRALAKLAEQSSDCPLEATATSLAEYAGHLGDYLKFLDEVQGRSRDESLATAFPTSGADAQKSRDRYANQFVASVNKRGEVSGLLVDLKLVNVEQKTGADYLRLTEPGWTFSMLENPLLDAGDQPRDRFSQAEIEFLLDHIRRSVPVEAFAIRAVLGAIRDGHHTPTTLDAELARYRSPKPEHKITDAYLTTQRSGVIARMSDLQLIRRARDGARVRYELTDVGTEYLRQLQKREAV